MTTTIPRPHLLERRTDARLEDDRLAEPRLPDGNPVIPVPPGTHPAEELVHPWVD